MTGRSLKARGSSLVEGAEQVRYTSEGTLRLKALPRFEQKLTDGGMPHLLPTTLSVLQINVGKMCNQVCKHCHVDAGPDRREIMTKDTMTLCLAALRSTPSFKTVDLTGGAPEMNPSFRWFIEEIRAIRPDIEIIVRCNLTIILANKSYHDLPDFFAQHRIHVVSSLPFYQKNATDRQRGDGVFDHSIRALQMLNAVGYGMSASGLKLDLVYNPVGAFLPGPQEDLQREFKRELKTNFGIEFNELFTITNIPVSRYLEYLITTDNLEDYMATLVSAYNHTAATQVMCRSMVSVGWDGYLYDCDFNQMLEMKSAIAHPHLRDWDQQAMLGRQIVVKQHCFGCTAGSGSSCGGTTA
jgi:radical SAM/Cys-rich protein